MQLLRTNNYKLLNNRLPSKSVFFGNLDLQRVAQLANVSEKQISQLTFHRLKSIRCLAFQQRFLMKALHLSGVRVCPQCYGELGNIDFINSLTSKTYCTRHHCRLVYIHPQTGNYLTWATDYLWRDAENWQSPTNSEISDSEIIINQHIEELTHKPLLIEQYPINLAEYCDLLEFFAHFHQVAYNTNQLFNKKEVMQCAEYYTTAHTYVANWPTKYFELLNYFELNPMSEHRITGLRKCFRDLYDNIFCNEHAGSNAYDLLRKGFNTYVSEFYSGGSLHRSITRLDEDTLNNSSTVCEVELSKIFDCHPSKIKVYLREGLLNATHTLKNGKAMYSRSEAQELKIRLTKCLSIGECAELLEISVYQIRQLLRKNVIQAILKPSSVNRDWLVEQNQIELLISRLSEGCSKIDPKTTNAHKRFAFAKVDFSCLIERMLNGTVDYYFKPNDATPFSLGQFVPFFQSSDMPNQDFITPREATIRLGVNLNAIYDFIKLGYLYSEKRYVNRTPRPVKMIPASSIQNFKRRYLLTKELRDMPVKNVTAVSGPEIDGCCVKIYAYIAGY